MKIFSFPNIAIVLLLTGCGSDSSNDPLSFENSYQEIREHIVKDFSENTTLARKKYGKVFKLGERPDGKTLVAKMVVCGQLQSNRIQLDESCSKDVRAGLIDRNDQIRGIAVSALAFNSDEESLGFIAEKLKDNSDIVRIEAAQALNYRLNTAMADPNHPNAADSVKTKLMPYCTSIEMTTSALEELCAKVE